MPDFPFRKKRDSDIRWGGYPVSKSAKDVKLERLERTCQIEMPGAGSRSSVDDLKCLIGQGGLRERETGSQDQHEWGCLGIAQKGAKVCRPRT